MGYYIILCQHLLSKISQKSRDCKTPSIIKGRRMALNRWEMAVYRFYTVGTRQGIGWLTTCSMDKKVFLYDSLPQKSCPLNCRHRSKLCMVRLHKLLFFRMCRNRIMVLTVDASMGSSLNTWREARGYLARFKVPLFSPFEASTPFSSTMSTHTLHHHNFNCLNFCIPTQLLFARILLDVSCEELQFSYQGNIQCSPQFTLSTYM